MSQTTFQIDHYAGKVTYDVGGFLEKNKHSLLQGKECYPLNCFDQKYFSRRRTRFPTKLSVPSSNVIRSYRSLSDKQKQTGKVTSCGRRGR